MPPSSLDGIEKYLGSGMIKGIGVGDHAIHDALPGISALPAPDGPFTRDFHFGRPDQNPYTGTDFPICQDTRSGSQVCGLARSVVCHHALKDLAGEKAFETADDLPFGPPFSGASFDVVEGW